MRIHILPIFWVKLGIKVVRAIRIIGILFALIGIARVLVIDTHFVLVIRRLLPLSHSSPGPKDLCTGTFQKLLKDWPGPSH